MLWFRRCNHQAQSEWGKQANSIENQLMFIFSQITSSPHLCHILFCIIPSPKQFPPSLALTVRFHFIFMTSLLCRVRMKNSDLPKVMSVNFVPEPRTTWSKSNMIAIILQCSVTVLCWSVKPNQDIQNHKVGRELIDHLVQPPVLAGNIPRAAYLGAFSVVAPCRQNPKFSLFVNSSDCQQSIYHSSCQIRVNFKGSWI